MQLLTTQRQMPSLFSSRSPWQAFPPGYRLSMTSPPVEYPLGQFRSAVPAVPPPSFLCPPDHSLVSWCEKPKSPWLKVRSTSQELIHQCVINLMLILNLKHGIISATRKKPALSQLKPKHMATLYSSSEEIIHLCADYKIREGNALLNRNN